MESTNGQVRPMPGYGNRNGMVTRFKPYVYRGTGEDIMPHAITDDTSTASLDDLGIEAKRPRSYSRRGQRCQQCDRDYGSRWHKAHCR